MPKRLLLLLGVLMLAIAACKSAGNTTPSATPTPTPTPNPSASTATIDAMYNGAPYSGTIYANAATGGCPGSTTITGSTLTATATPVGGQNYSQAIMQNLTPDTYYVFFYVAPPGFTVASQCTLQWSVLTVYLTYP